MRVWSALAAFAAVLVAVEPACAQMVTSAEPDSVSVTIYRSPDRSPSSGIDSDWLTGYALITEKRTVTIPSGRAVIRFEGVAGGMLPESAIVTDLPSGVTEKNLDADLLSPRSLYSRMVGRPVTIRRTIKGKSVEEPAIIRSGPDGAAILQTREGFIAADCGPSQDDIVYDSVPAGLSAKPTLSVQTDSPRAGKVTLTLSYLSWNFDWQTNYVATMRGDGKTADLLAWVTLASSDVTSFPNAETVVVAGRLNRETERDGSGASDGALSFSCFPHPVAVPPPAPAPQMAFRSSASAMAEEDKGAEIIVTGTHITRQEELGDLKLYRIPDTTTVAAMSQKQVMMFDKKSVPVDVVYRSRAFDDETNDVRIVLRAQNRKDKGLGLPLPAGQLALFEPLGERSMLVGEGSLTDKAINEEVEVEVASATQVTARIDDGEEGDNWQDHVLTVTNANPWPVRYEAELEVSDGYHRTRASGRLMRHNGHDVWAVEVPANGEVKLTYRLKDTDE